MFKIFSMKLNRYNMFCRYLCLIVNCIMQEKIKITGLTVNYRLAGGAKKFELQLKLFFQLNAKNVISHTVVCCGKVKSVAPKNKLKKTFQKYLHLIIHIRFKSILLLLENLIANLIQGGNIAETYWPKNSAIETEIKFFVQKMKTRRRSK